MRITALFSIAWSTLLVSSTLPLASAWAQEAGSVALPAPEPVAAPPIDAMGQWLDWIRDAYDREPQLVLACAAMVLGLTLLSLLALVYSGTRRGMAALQSRWPVTGKPAAPIIHNAAPKRTIPALEIVDDGATALPVRGRMVRIGRHEENDICLSSKSVHRYHAVMHLTEEQCYIITDISGLDGNGVFVNAERIDNVTLQNGDLIELGDVKLRFRLSELH